jgi:hypothetical protein
MAGRKFDEVVAALESGELDPEEAASELKRFSTSTLKEQAERVPALEKERDEAVAKAERLEKAPLKRKAFEEYGIDFESLRPAEIAAIEAYEGELEPEKVGEFAGRWELPMTERQQTSEEPPNAAAIAQAARTSPPVRGRQDAGQITPEDMEDWSTESLVRFKKDHPKEFEALKRGDTVKVLVTPG